MCTNRYPKYRDALTGQDGFSTMDLFLTLLLAAILAAATIPGIQSAVATYHRNGAARTVLAEIRATQSLAVTRGGTFGFQWGAGSSRPDSEYRIARDMTGTCGFPAVDAPEDDTDVIRRWSDLDDIYAEVRVQSIRDKNDKLLDGVMFSSSGASVNTCTGVSFPITVTVSDASGMSREIEIRSAGSTRLL